MATKLPRNALSVAKEGKVFEKKKKLLQPFLGTPEGTKMTWIIFFFYKSYSDGLLYCTAQKHGSRSAMEWYGVEHIWYIVMWPWLPVKVGLGKLSRKSAQNISGQKSQYLDKGVASDKILDHIWIYAQLHPAEHSLCMVWMHKLDSEQTLHGEEFNPRSVDPPIRDISTVISQPRYLNQDI